MRDAPVQEVCGDAVRGDDIGRPFHERVSAVGGEDYGRRHWGLEEGIEVSETFDVQHVNLTIVSNELVACGGRAGQGGRTSSIKTTPGTTSAVPWST